MDTTTNAEHLDRIAAWQAAGYTPELTCGNDTHERHVTLVGEERNGRVVLVCPDPFCDYVQTCWPALPSRAELAEMEPHRLLARLAQKEADQRFQQLLYGAAMRLEERGHRAARSILASAGIRLDPGARFLAVGASPEGTARAWCQATGQAFTASADASLDFLPERFDWALRFQADGDGMKAAGVILPNGTCLMTWIK